VILSIVVEKSSLVVCGVILLLRGSNFTTRTPTNPPQNRNQTIKFQNGQKNQRIK
jgi:hypothetical protein